PKISFLSFRPLNFQPTQKTLTNISCRKQNKRENLSDDEMLAVELRLGIKKMSSQMVSREGALKKSREILFIEVCNFTGMKSEDLKNKWHKINEDERWGLVLGFVAEWSNHFHPSYVKSVMEMVDEYLGDNIEFPDNPVSISSDGFFYLLEEIDGVF
ncbi:hypothetical protein PHJA_001350500, partial [Phtheirospermum japonicum]